MPPIDYSIVMQSLQALLLDHYSHYPSPLGNGKSAQFEMTVFEITQKLFAEVDSANSYPEGYHRVEYLGGKIFPDNVISCETTGIKIGLEVKYHDSAANWKTNGNSTYATTQIEDLSEIFLAFGNFHSTPSFQVRPYNDCISGISITHSPRYDIDMSATTNFCLDELGITYNTLRTLNPDQRKIYVNTYLAKTKYSILSGVEADRKATIIAQLFILFPEMFSRNPRIRYNNASVWLFANNIICKNIRDFITAGGRDTVGNTVMPKLYVTLHRHKDKIREIIGSIPAQVLSKAWYDDAANTAVIPEATNDRLEVWVGLIFQQHGSDRPLIETTELNFVDTIKSWLDI